MKKIHLLVIIGVFFLIACDKSENNTVPENEQPQKNTLGCITGKITIFNTGSVTDAYVRLSLSENGAAIYSKLIASNGDYTIENVEAGTYFFRVYKQGHLDELFNEAIEIQPKEQNGGSCRLMDWAITKLPPSLYIVAVGTENKIDTLDFGISENRLYFQIYNNSTNTYTWFSDFEEVKLDADKKWLSSMNPIGGTLTPSDKPEIITITIDRTKLDTGINRAKFLIDSDRGGGEILNIIATRQ